MALESFDLLSRRKLPVLISFIDIGGFFRASLRIADLDLADLLDEYYSKVTGATNEAGGRVVKFMGDSALIVFPEHLADAGVRALLKLKSEVDRWLEQQGLRSDLAVKIHFGDAVAGPFGPPGEQRFDVIGNDVNAAAVIQTRGLALSAQAFRRLRPETRKLFKKHTPPIIYVPVEDRRP